MKNIKTAFILAGGRGTRLGELTEEIPKPMIKVAGKPILHHMTDWFSSYGVKRFVLAIHYKKEKIIEYFGDGKELYEELIYTEETLPMGTGGALKLAEKHLKDTFIFANGDILTNFNLYDMMEFHFKHKALLTIALKAVKEPKRFGVAQLDGDRIEKFIEKPEIPSSNFINAGICIAEPEIIKYIPPNKFCSFEREVIPLITEKRKTFGYKVLGPWIDIGLPEALKMADELW
jgi:mannose-1-phosphate guanylyltransferase